MPSNSIGRASHGASSPQMVRLRRIMYVFGTGIPCLPIWFHRLKEPRTPLSYPWPGRSRLTHGQETMDTQEGCRFDVRIFQRLCPCLRVLQMRRKTQDVDLAQRRLVLPVVFAVRGGHAGREWTADRTLKIEKNSRNVLTVRF